MKRKTRRRHDPSLARGSRRCLSNANPPSGAQVSKPAPRARRPRRRDEHACGKWMGAQQHARCGTSEHCGGERHRERQVTRANQKRPCHPRQSPPLAVRRSGRDRARCSCGAPHLMEIASHCLSPQRRGRLRLSKGTTATNISKAMIATATAIHTRMRGLTASSPAFRKSQPDACP